jgi:hypothetical protein
VAVGQVAVGLVGVGLMAVGQVSATPWKSLSIKLCELKSFDTSYTLKR